MRFFIDFANVPEFIKPQVVKAWKDKLRDMGIRAEGCDDNVLYMSNNPDGHVNWCYTQDYYDRYYKQYTQIEVYDALFSFDKFCNLTLKDVEVGDSFVICLTEYIKTDKSQFINGKLHWTCIYDGHKLASICEDKDVNLQI